MKLVPITITSLATLLFAGVLVAASAQDKKAPEQRAPEKKESALVSSDTAKFTEAIPGVSRAMISGDPDKGAYRAFTKFAPGVAHAMHTHPNDMWIVVLKGAYTYKPEKGDEVRVGPGSSFHIPAGERHASSGDPKDGVLFFEESTGKFGLDFVDKK